ncbi:MAG: transporter substrate-binding domain-containing protein [Ruminococcaceae bacterium]|nr:transporter substrate-binding domain-containing protein [Oscillospiraceae bacterium]
MKKILSLVLAMLLIAVMFAGCSGQTAREYKVLDETLADEQYGIGFRKADCSLRDEVQRILCEMKADGTLASISNTWFGADVTTVPDTFVPTATEDDGSLTKVKEAGKFILGLDDSFPPMGYNKDGEIIGFDIDLAKEVCKRMGVELVLQPIVWAQNVSELNAGNIDCIWNGMTINETRAEAMNLSESYMANRQVVVALKSSPISTLADLAGKTAVLQAGSTAVDALAGNAAVKDSLAEAVEVENNVLAMYELANGTGDVVIMDEIVARYYIEHLTELEDAAKN